MHFSIVINWIINWICFFFQYNRVLNREAFLLRTYKEQKCPGEQTNSHYNWWDWFFLSFDGIITKSNSLNTKTEATPISGKTAEEVLVVCFLWYASVHHTIPMRIVIWISHGHKIIQPKPYKRMLNKKPKRCILTAKHANYKAHCFWSFFNNKSKVCCWRWMPKISSTSFPVSLLFDGLTVYWGDVVKCIAIEKLRILLISRVDVKRG